MGVSAQTVHMAETWEMTRRRFTGKHYVAIRALMHTFPFHRLCYLCQAQQQAVISRQL